MAQAGTPGVVAPRDTLTDITRLIDQYYTRRPEPEDPRQRVSFGTSGHRGTATDGTFNEAHIAAITLAICEYRHHQGFTGPLFLGKDTHALSAPAQQTALEVLAAQQVATVIQADDGYTPTPVISRQILAHNRGRSTELADGIVITPSHNPPADGGFKYNPPHGGPADTDATTWIQDRANALLRAGTVVPRRRLDTTRPDCITAADLMTPYVEDLSAVIDFDVIRAAGLRVGVDPLGGAAVRYWEPIQTRYGINLSVVNPGIDPQFAFMPLDHDGKIRMDCSSPYAMANLVGLKDSFDVAFGNDPDVDRHGIVTRSAGLLNPNHYLAVAIRYLFTHRPQWPAQLAVGKTAVSSGIIDRVAQALGRVVCEVPVGFKWFVDGLYTGQFGFAGEESAGASFLRRDGTVWTTDKDGLILGLLAAEITARTGRDPGEHFADITREFGQPCYRRLDQPADARQKAVLKNLSPRHVTAATLAGDPITDKQTHAPGNQAALGGLKVVTAAGWFAARPSGTENVYKIYAESFRDPTHLERIIDEARLIVDAALQAAG
ncbi:MAG: phosphoglucomutase (alpha-D-glucose-1,6-bisphosphate-dependent) [Pirellulaceae bacterium]|jgi:phosphoglucomutase|nr:phosphoglucomutase (alpha-D-glucose-1,6-bisphosphate-dependent) [Pirellulaceae bacterium]